HGDGRPFPGRRDESAVLGALAPRPAPARLRRARRAAGRRHHPRVENPDEGDTVSELRGKIQQVIADEPVALFMKGTPQMVMCGNSHRALEALRQVGAPVTTVDILPDPAIRQELSAVSGWPTIPQIFIRGELIGGADITEEPLA